jgi:hypothetical protein
MIDTPRTYRIPGKWGWFFTLSEDDREDVCFGHDPAIRDELERNEWIICNESGPGYYKAVARVKELEELLEPAGEVTGGSKARRDKGDRKTGLHDRHRPLVMNPEITDGALSCLPPVTSFAGRVNSSTADETGSLSPESEAVLENHQAGGMAA